jgi:short-subunit dehydrogenase
MNFAGCTALVTGASSGIGEAIARELAPRLLSLVLVARREDRLKALARELQGRYGSLRVEIIAADLSTASGVEQVLSELQNRQLSVDILINNAGLGDIGTLRSAPWTRLEPMLLVNVVALTRLTQALLPAMVERQRGAILNVSSSASFLPIPSFAVYAATKAYVTSFSEAVRAEVSSKGVNVTALCPGPVPTEFNAVASRPGGKREFSSPSWLAVTPQEVALEALRGLQTNKPLVMPGLGLKFVVTALRLTPRWVLRILFSFGADKM